MLIGWISFILIISLVSFSKVKEVNIENGDKYVHFILYFVLTYLLFYSRFLPADYSKKVKLLVALLSAVSFGIIIEIMQRELTINRQFEWSDIFANSLGSLLAVVFVHKISDKNFFFK